MNHATGPDLFTPRPVFVAAANADRFTPEFLADLPDNLPVYQAFECEALKVARRGFRHYSARTIIEVLRHHTAVADSGFAGGAWKLNNNNTPFFARLFTLLNPEHGSLFEFREAKSARREAA